MKKNILLFGAGKYGISAAKRLKKEFNIIGFIDNDINKQGKKIYGYQVYSPDIINTIDYSYIYVTSMYAFEIMNQLTENLNVTPDKIEYIDYVKSKNYNKIIFTFLIIIIICIYLFY